MVKYCIVFDGTVGRPVYLLVVSLLVHSLGSLPTLEEYS